MIEIAVMESQLNTGRRVKIHDGAGAFPDPPTVGPGSILDWHPNGRGPRAVVVQIQRVSGAGDVTIAGPVELCGYDVELASWFVLGTLNGGEAITVDAVGYAERVQDVGVFDELQLRGATPGGGTVDVYITPIEELP